MQVTASGFFTSQQNNVKILNSAEEAVQDIPSGARVFIGGNTNVWNNCLMATGVDACEVRVQSYKGLHLSLDIYRPSKGDLHGTLSYSFVSVWLLVMPILLMCVWKSLHQMFLGRPVCPGAPCQDLSCDAWCWLHFVCKSILTVFFLCYSLLAAVVSSSDISMYLILSGLWTKSILLRQFLIAVWTLFRVC